VGWVNGDNLSLRLSISFIDGLESGRQTKISILYKLLFKIDAITPLEDLEILCVNAGKSHRANFLGTFGLLSVLVAFPE